MNPKHIWFAIAFNALMVGLLGTVVDMRHAHQKAQIEALTLRINALESREAGR